MRRVSILLSVLALVLLLTSVDAGGPVTPVMRTDGTNADSPVFPGAVTVTGNLFASSTAQIGTTTAHTGSTLADYPLQVLKGISVSGGQIRFSANNNWIGRSATINTQFSDNGVTINGGTGFLSLFSVAGWVGIGTLTAAIDPAVKLKLNGGMEISPGGFAVIGSATRRTDSVLTVAGNTSITSGGKIMDGMSKPLFTPPVWVGSNTAENVMGWMQSKFNNGDVPPNFGYLATTTLDLGTGGYGQYDGCCLASTGLVVFAPYDAANIKVFDPVSEASFNVLASTTANKFQGACLTDKNKVVFVPYFHKAFGVYDLVTNTYSEILAPELEDEAFTQSGVLTSIGTVVMFPRSHDYFVEIDVENATYTSYFIAASSFMFSGAVRTVNDKIVSVPSGRAFVGVFDPVTKSYSEIAARGGFSFNGGVSTPDGNVVFCPSGTTYVGKFNPITNTYTEHNLVVGHVSNHFIGASLLPNGMVMFGPNSGMQAGIFDWRTNKLTQIQLSQKFWGRCLLLPDGRVLLPKLNGYVCTWNPLMGGIDLGTCMSPWFNK